MAQRRLPAPVALAALFGAGLASAALAQDPTPDPATAARDEAWAVRLARMEGASVHVEEAAGELAETAGRIADSGRIQALSDLASDAGQLNRRVVSLTLATEVLVELEPAPTEP